MHDVDTDAVMMMDFAELSTDVASISIIHVECRYPSSL